MNQLLKYLCKIVGKNYKIKPKLQYACQLPKHKDLGLRSTRSSKYISIHSIERRSVYVKKLCTYCLMTDSVYTDSLSGINQQEGSYYTESGYTSEKFGRDLNCTNIFF